MKIIILAIISALSLSAISMNDIARTQLDDTLNDSRTARLKEVKYGNTEIKGLEVICGKVNDKNTYGAYEGFKKFVIINKNVNIDNNKSNSIFEVKYNSKCK